MVRLVFRPYTQVRRSICTSESLWTSTRVSSGFILLRHSSPSFGSQRVRSISAQLTMQYGRDHGAPPPKRRIPCQSAELNFTFITPLGVATQWLAHMLDSLVRVSRRVRWVTDWNTRKGHQLEQHSSPHQASQRRASTKPQFNWQRSPRRRVERASTRPLYQQLGFRKWWDTNGVGRHSQPYIQRQHGF